MLWCFQSFAVHEFSYFYICACALGLSKDFLTFASFSLVFPMLFCWRISLILHLCALVFPVLSCPRISPLLYLCALVFLMLFYSRSSPLLYLCALALPMLFCPRVSPLLHICALVFLLLFCPRISPLLHLCFGVSGIVPYNDFPIFAPKYFYFIIRYTMLWSIHLYLKFEWQLLQQVGEASLQTCLFHSQCFIEHILKWYQLIIHKAPSLSILFFLTNNKPSNSIQFLFIFYLGRRLCTYMYTRYKSCLRTFF